MKINNMDILKMANVFALCLTALLCLILEVPYCEANSDAKKLYENLLKNSGYNKFVRPVLNASDKITVKVGLKLSQLIDVDEKNQIMTTNVWVTQEWVDPSLHWNPEDYGKVDLIYVPADSIWHPDIVLYNTGDGTYEMTKGTKAMVNYEGVVKWTPPASFKSSCNIDVTYFPFDQQVCGMSFCSWTYNVHEVDLVHIWQQTSGAGENETLSRGIDTKEFYRSVEWDIMNVPAAKAWISYAGSAEDHAMWSFNVTLKRKFLFYTVNLIVPLVSHAFITVLVFYLPADSKEKIALCINILLSLTVFFLMLAEIIPPTSIVVPLLGKYLVFTLVLVATSVIITVLTYNVHFRSASTHVMPDWVRKIFLYWMPRILMMRRPKIENSHDVELKYIKLQLCPCFRSGSKKDFKSHYSHAHQDQGNKYQFGSKRTRTQMELYKLSRELDEDTRVHGLDCAPEVQKAIEGAIFVANHLKKEDEFNRTKEDWKYVALVIDRIFLWIYTMVCAVGTIGIICQAPMLYDMRTPMHKWDDSNQPTIND